MRTVSAVAVGLVVGFLAALGGAVAFRFVSRPPTEEIADAPLETAAVDLFRLPSGRDRELFLLPAGPDATGEPNLAARLFPGEDPPRRLASLVFANVSASERWDVDLTSSPIRCRSSAQGGWEPLGLLDERTASGSGLSPADELRLRSLGAGAARFDVAARTCRHVLLALPKGCRIADLSDVQWDGTPLVRDRLDLERVRRFRLDPGAVTTGR